MMVLEVSFHHHQNALAQVVQIRSLRLSNLLGSVSLLKTHAMELHSRVAPKVDL